MAKLRTATTEYQKTKLDALGLPVPAFHDEAQHLIDTRAPATDHQLALIRECGIETVPETCGMGKALLEAYKKADLVGFTRAKKRLADKRAAEQAESGEEPVVDNRAPSPGMIEALMKAGVKQIPQTFAMASEMIDNLPPTERMAEVLREHNVEVPETRAEANLLIDELPATKDQKTAIRRRTGGAYEPRTRRDAKMFYARQRRRGTQRRAA